MASVSRSTPTCASRRGGPARRRQGLAPDGRHQDDRTRSAPRQRTQGAEPRCGAGRIRDAGVTGREGGLEQGDVILKVNGQDVSGLQQLRVRIATATHRRQVADHHLAQGGRRGRRHRAYVLVGVRSEPARFGRVRRGDEEFRSDLGDAQRVVPVISVAKSGVAAAVGLRRGSHPPGRECRTGRAARRDLWSRWRES